MSLTLNVTSLNSCLKINVLDGAAEVSVSFDPRTFTTDNGVQVFYKTDVRVFDLRTGKDLTEDIQELMSDWGMSCDWHFVTFEGLDKIVRWTTEYLLEND